MYVCGITPYDATHLGHAATMITFDLVHRVWRDAGRPVRYVQNVTDIDDPLLERAARDGEDWVVLAMRETALFREDMEALRIIPPDALRRRGGVDPGRSPSRSASCSTTAPRTALDDGTGDVYFDIAAGPAVRLRVATCPASRCWRCSPSAAATRTGPGKRDPLDPLLWRGARDGRAGLGRRRARARAARAGTSSAR